MIQSLQRFLQRKFVRDTIILQMSKFGVVVLGLLAWIIVPVRLGPYNYGLFALAQSFVGIWQVLNLTGLSTSTGILLSTAIGAKNDTEIVDLLAIHVKVSLIWALLSVLVLMTLGPAIAALLYQNPVSASAANALSYSLLSGLEIVGNSQVGTLAGYLALVLFFDPIFNLILTAFRSRRSMKLYAVLQNTNQFVLTVCLVTAAIISPTPGGQVVGRIVYSVVTLGIAFVLYERSRDFKAMRFPSIKTVARRTLTVSYGPYWRFGLANAIDKNLSGAYVNITMQMVGVIAGPAAASYLQIGIRGLNKANIVTSAIFENMQAVIPQAIGRQDYARLRENFLRVLVVLGLGGLVFYALVIVLAPFFIVPIFGEEWIPVLPLLPALCVYGLTTTIGGVFGPLYRAFDLMRAAISIKIIALAIMLPIGFWLISQTGSLGGVWMLNGLFMISVALTMFATLPVLQRYATQEVAQALEVEKSV